MSLLKTTNLTKAYDPKIEDAAEITHPGMAHFAGTGPRSRTCRQCEHLDHSKTGWWAINGKHRGKLKPAPCRKYKLLTGAAGAAVPPEAIACKYFRDATVVPKLYDKS